MLLLAVVAVTAVTGYRAEKKLVTPPAFEAYDFAADDPLAVAERLASMRTDGESSEEDYAVALSEVLGHYDAWIAKETASVLEYPLNQESLRLLAAAKAEVQEGRLVNVDPLAQIDLEYCRDILEPHQCVLLRYAAEGLQWAAVGFAGGKDMTIAEGLGNGVYGNWRPLPAIYQIQMGLTRYYAAVRAMFPLSAQHEDATEVLQALANLREGVLSVEYYLPGAQSPVRVPTTAIPETTPAEVIQEVMK
ncbi:hypothetical protein IQ273_02360 [Nodosilinea sp. LEGE 07298]|uniref:hypothetical protein n=1 Tax=Nodosilinea sp. LEGE 07298 TaxID=2777970 RepID=UPI001882BFEE|nr:hypothetical protein [Nodosilinea sp. LEGE 07298]MBE9108265.1 hypothetical protein [Nodosilinea sp. LEGE 07298]